MTTDASKEGGKMEQTTTKARRATVRFGPGSLESISLVLSPAKHDRYILERTGHQQARVEGTFRIYCGAGWDHAAEISSPTICLGCAGGEHYSKDDFELAAELVNDELEDWFDPCDDE